MDCGLGAAAPPSNLRIAVIIQRIEQKPLPLGGSTEGQHRQNFIQRLPLADQFLRGGTVGQNAMGGDYVLVTLASVPAPPLFPVKAPLGTLGQLPELVKGGGVLIGHFAAVSLDGNFHRVILLFRFGEVRNLNRKGGPRHRGRMGQSPEKAKMPEQHKAVRALGVAIWVDKKRLFSQTWVEFAVAGVRLFLTVVYTIKRTRQYLLTVAVSFQSKRADNRISNLRVIGSASARLAL